MKSPLTNYGLIYLFQVKQGKNICIPADKQGLKYNYSSIANLSKIYFSPEKYGKNILFPNDKQGLNLLITN